MGSRRMQLRMLGVAAGFLAAASPQLARAECAAAGAFGAPSLRAAFTGMPTASGSACAEPSHHAGGHPILLAQLDADSDDSASRGGLRLRTGEASAWDLGPSWSGDWAAPPGSAPSGEVSGGESADGLSSLLSRLGGVVASFEPFFDEGEEGSETRSFGGEVSGALPADAPGLPDLLSFGAQRHKDADEVEQLTWIGGGWGGDASRLELDIGLHQTEDEESVTLGAAWRVSPLPSSSFSLEADADFTEEPAGRVLFEGRLSF